MSLHVYIERSSGGMMLTYYMAGSASGQDEANPMF